jgi:transposase
VPSRPISWPRTTSCCPIVAAMKGIPTPEPIRAIIQYEMELGYSDDAITAGPYGVCLRTVQRMRRSFKQYGLVYIEPSDHGGRPQVLSDFYKAELLHYLEQRPSAYLDEMVYFLWDEYELQVDEATVFRALRRLRWSRKQNRKIAAQRNVQLRSRWLVTKLPQYRADQLVFLDESAACERTGEGGPI